MKPNFKKPFTLQSFSKNGKYCNRNGDEISDINITTVSYRIDKMPFFGKIDVNENGKFNNNGENSIFDIYHVDDNDQNDDVAKQIINLLYNVNDICNEHDLNISGDFYNGFVIYKNSEEIGRTY